jgi:hypothetical protein
LREGFFLQVREANGVERSQLGCVKAFYFLSRHCCVTGFAPAAVPHLMLVYAGQVCNIVDVYHIAAGTWSTAQLSEARAAHAATSVGNVALFAGGYASGTMPIHPSKTVDLYDYSTSKWSTAQLSSPRFVFAATSVGNVAFFAGGYAGDSFGA